MNRLLEQFIRISAWLSQGVNCIFLFGSEDMTVSARCYFNQDKLVWGVAYELINFIFFWQVDHCKHSAGRDAEHSQQVLEMWEKAKSREYCNWM